MQFLVLLETNLKIKEKYSINFILETIITLFYEVMKKVLPEECTRVVYTH